MVSSITPAPAISAFRLCIDAGPTENGHRWRGIGSVARHLLAAMTPALGAAHGATLRYLRRRPEAASPSAWVRRSWPAEWSGADVRVPQSFANWWQPLDAALVLPGDVMRAGADVFLATDPHAVALSDAFATVAILYDVVPLVFPEAYLTRRWAGLPAWRYHRRLARMRRADRLIAISQATKDDAVRLADFDPARITVAPLAVDRAAFPAVDPMLARARVAERFGVTRPYLLFVGATDMRKNLPGLLSAYEGLSADRAVDLVVVGQARPDMVAAHPTVRWISHVAPDELPMLYAGAAVFAFPTLYEGFGLPVLEAMSAGVPVVTSPLSAVPEVAGDAALYADPRDARALADALRRVLDDAALRAELRRRGFARAASFTWVRTAETILTVCAEVAARRR